MPNRGMTLVSAVAALSVAATVSLLWLTLWQQQQTLQQIHQWRLSMVQLQQAQRNFYQQQGRFATTQSELVTAGMLAAKLVFPFTDTWQFDAQQHILVMRGRIHRQSVTLLMQDFNGYLWQPPYLSMKVIGHASP